MYLVEITLSPRTTKIDSSLPPAKPVAVVISVAWANKKYIFHRDCKFPFETFYRNENYKFHPPRSYPFPPTAQPSRNAHPNKTVPSV